jgi:drug/metabolite transporter (DMT)-like permease
VVGVAAALVTACLWALTAMLVKVEARRLSVLSINAYRATVGMVALLAAFFLLRDPATLLTVPPASYAVLAVSVLLGMVGGATCNFYAIMRIGLGRAFPISGAYPLLTVVIASLVFPDERMGPSELVGALLTLGGVILVAMPQAKATTPLDQRDNLVGVGLAVAAAIFWALSSIVTKIGMTGLELLTATAIRLPMAAVALWLLLVYREGWPPKTPPWRLSRVSALTVVVAGLLGPALSNYLWMLGIQEIGAARTDVLAATGPVFAVALAALVLREPVSRRVVAGTLLSVVGIMLVVARLGG